MKVLRLPALFALLSFSVAAILAEDNEATHNELRALRAGVLDAINSGNIEQQLTWLHPNVVVTWHNAEVSRGREGVRAYYERLTQGPEKMVEKFSAELTVDELTILHGEDTGISFGSSVEHFGLTNGKSFDLNGRWSATLVKEDGKWLIASLHVSSNLFDNVMLDLAKRYAMWMSAALCGIGVLVGWLIGRRRRRAPA